MADDVTIRITDDATAFMEAPNNGSLYERMIALIDSGPDDADVIAMFRGQTSINDVRDRMGLVPDAFPCSDEKGLLNPYAYTMEIGESLAEAIIDRMVNGESQIERDFIHHCRKQRDFFLRKYCGAQF